MKTYNTEEIRNIALLGNSGSGKTTLAELMLYNGGVTNRVGHVENKNTVSDYNEVEHENSNSVFSSVLYTEYANKKINIIDAPGLDDFIGGVVSALNPADTGVMLINATNGVEVGTEIHSRFLERNEKPCILVINHLDHDKSNFEKTMESVNQSFGSKVILAQYPVDPGLEFNAVIDLITMKMLKYHDDSGKPEVLDIPDDQKERADQLHNELVEKAAENDEELMELFFEKESLDEEEMRKGIMHGILNRDMFPVFCTSSKKNVGVDRLMEFIGNALPAPHMNKSLRDAEDNEVNIDPSGKTTLYVFKTTFESHIGEINYFKVISGEVSEGMDLTNNNTQTKERFSQIYVAAGKNRTKVPKLIAGDIGAAVKLKNTKSNHTLTSQDISTELPPVQFPEPKYRTAIKPLSEGDEEKMSEALTRMHESDPTIIIEYSKELKQILIHGQGEYHLNILKWHLDNIYKIETQFIDPKIPYRETITKLSQADYRHKKQSGGAGQFGEVHMVIEPYKEGMPDPTVYKVNGKEIKVSVRDKQQYDLEWGGKLIFYNCIVGGSIDTRFHPAIVKGIMEKMENGPLTGSYARDIRVAIYDGKMHPVDSNEISFKLAGRNAFQIAFKNAGPKIMEPIYMVEVLVPSDRMGDVMSDLQGRRAVVQGMSSEKGFEKITAKVPLAEMGKYSTSLSSITNGRAMYNMKFSEYAQVPGEIQEKLLKEHEAAQDEEE